MTRNEKTIRRVKRDAERIRELIKRADIEKLTYHDVLIETFIQAMDELIEEETECNKSSKN